MKKNVMVITAIMALIVNTIALTGMFSQMELFSNHRGEKVVITEELAKREDMKYVEEVYGEYYSELQNYMNAKATENGGWHTVTTDGDKTYITWMSDEYWYSLNRNGYYR